MKFFAFFLALNFWCTSKAQELTIISFTASNGTSVSLTRDTINHVISYREVVNGEVKLKYNGLLTEEDVEFFWATGYFRGGGVDNAGLDLNYIHFMYEGYEYIIYDEWSAEDNKRRCGVRIEVPDGVDLPELEDLIATDNSIEGGFSYRFIEGVGAIDSEY